MTMITHNNDRLNMIWLFHVSKKGYVYVMGYLFLGEILIS